MGLLKPLQTQTQETLRRLAKPLIINDIPWEGSNNEVKALTIKFEEYGFQYAQNVNYIRRNWDNLHEGYEEQFPSDLPSLMTLFPDESIEANLLVLKMWNNVRWAKARGNKYLLSEDLDGFPSMNYTLKEGPYMPPLDAKFGAEDFHVLLQGLDNNLIFLQPRLYGVTKGWYVESSL